MKVATAPSGTDTAVANLRFGMRIPAAQTAANYTAGIDFEVVAPAA